MKRMNWRLRLGLALGIALNPARVLACAACYGQSDSPLAQGMNWGIVSLLGVVVCVLASIATFFVFLGRRSAAMPAQTESPEKTSRTGLENK